MKVVVLIIMLILPVIGSSQQNLLTGVSALACQAMVCLSDPMGDSLQECAPSLKKYYSIVKVTKLGGIDKVATKLARDAFLKLCPV